MNRICENMPVMDELNLFLVAHNTKPAASVYLHPFPFDLEGYSNKPGASPLELKLQFDDEDVTKFEKILANLGRPYQIGAKLTLEEEDPEYGTFRCELINASIGRDQTSLQRLLDAKTRYAKGLAYGYPEDSVRFFVEKIEGESRQGRHSSAYLARKAGIDIPTWIAYLSHGPRNLNLVNGNVCEASKELGTQYQECTRQHNPELAKRVEDYFLQEILINFN